MGGARRCGVRGAPAAMAATDGDKLAARNVILSARNHYEVMSLSRTCDEAEIKKRHRELARMVHPDKLQLASEAENLKTQQAFRAVQVSSPQRPWVAVLDMPLRDSQRCAFLRTPVRWGQ